MRSARVELILDTIKGVRGAKNLSAAVDDLADNMTEADRAGTKAAAAIDDAGDLMAKGARAAASLDRQIEEVTGSLRQMAIAQTLGGESFAKQMREQETQLRRLTKSRKLLGDTDAEVAAAATQIGGQLNRALAHLNLDPIDVKADPKSALKDLDEVERRLTALSNNASTVEIKVQAQRGLAEINRFRKQLGDIGDDGAVSFFAKFSGRLGPLLASMPISPSLVVPLAVAGAAAAPVFISAFASALSAGAGAGVLGIGLAALAKDPSIAARGAEVGKRFTDALTREARIGLQAPALEALDKLDAAGQRTATRLGQAFVKLGPELNPFVDKVIQAGEALTGSLVAAAERSGPALDAVGDSITLLADGASDFINIVADGGPEAAANLRLIAGATADTVRWTALLLKTANDLASNPWLTGPLLPILRSHYADAAGETQQLTESTKAADGSMRRLGSGTFGTASGVKAVGAAAEDTTAQVNPLYKAQETLAASMQTADAAARGERTALKGLSDQLRGDIDPAFALINAQNTLKTAQDKASEAVKNHGRKSKEAKAATRELALAAIDLQGRAGDLAGKFDGKLSPSMRATFKSAGLTKQQIHDLEKQMKTAKAAADKLAGNYKVNTSATGVPAVQRKLSGLLTFQDALKRGVSYANAQNRLDKVNRQLGLAKGGPVRGPGTGTSDSIEARLSNNEHVWTAEEVHKAGGHKQVERLREAAKAGQLPPGFAAGGAVTWPYPVTASKTRIPSVSEASNAVTPPVPTGGRTDDWIERTAKILVHGIRVISKYRPGATTLSGNRSYHSMHRAVDFEPSHALAVKWNNRYKAQTKEFISPWNSLNIHNGQRHAYSGAIYRQHSGGNAHDHIAMWRGGVIPEPVFGYGASGRSYSFGERGPERVTPMGGGGGVTVGPFTFIISGTNLSAREIADQVDRKVGATAELFSRVG